MPVHRTISDYRALGKALVQAAREGAEHAAKLLPTEITRHLREGKRPEDGSSQPPNAPATIERKRRLGLGAVPGVERGVLSSPQRWTVRKMSVRSWLVRPPIARRDAVYYLQRRRDPFELVSIPRTWLTVSLSKNIEAKIHVAMQRGKR